METITLFGEVTEDTNNESQTCSTTSSLQSGCPDNDVSLESGPRLFRTHRTPCRRRLIGSVVSPARPGRKFVHRIGQFGGLRWNPTQRGGTALRAGMERIAN